MMPVVWQGVISENTVKWDIFFQNLIYYILKTNPCKALAPAVFLVDSGKFVVLHADFGIEMKKNAINWGHSKRIRQENMVCALAIAKQMVYIYNRKIIRMPLFREQWDG